MIDLKRAQRYLEYALRAFHECTWCTGEAGKATDPYNRARYKKMASSYLAVAESNLHIATALTGASKGAFRTHGSI